MTRVSNVIKSRISNDEMAFQVSLQVLTAFMTAAGLVVAGLHYTVRRLGSKKEGIIPAAVAVKGTTTPVPPVVKSKKPKLSFMQSIGVLASDKYLRNVGIMVLCYGLSIEFTEIIWKAAIKKAYPQKVDYMKFMGGYSSLVGDYMYCFLHPIHQADV